MHKKKGLGIEIPKGHGDKDVFPSSSFLGEYVSLERSGDTMPTNATKALPILPCTHHEGGSHDPLSGGLEGDDRNLYNLGAISTT